MKRTEFIKELRTLLADLPKAEVEDIIADYEEHFAIGLKSKRSEADIAKGLGSPRVIAKHVHAERIVAEAHTSRKPRQIVRAVFAAAGLGFFNLMFILGPFLLMCGVIIALFAASAGITVAGGAAVVASIISFAGEWQIPVQISTGGIFGGIAAMCAGILAIIGMCYVVKWFFIGVIKYLKMNISIITQEDGQ